MKCLEDVKKIIDSYNIEPIMLPTGVKNVYELISDIPESRDNFESEKNDFYFINKYRKYIPKGYYGFSIGTPTNPKWHEVIDDVLELCIKNDPNIEIHAIKVKFGFMCFYVISEVIEDIHEIEVLIAKSLSDRAIIY
jgi:hypothetical protein